MSLVQELDGLDDREQRVLLVRRLDKLLAGEPAERGKWVAAEALRRRIDLGRMATASAAAALDALAQIPAGSRLMCISGEIEVPPG